MDIEGYVRRAFAAGRGEDEIVGALAREIAAIKTQISDESASELARAVVQEVKNTTGLEGDLFAYEHSGVTMGEFGVGSRGRGDFFAHRQFPRIIGNAAAAVGVDEMDDAGAVRAGGQYTIATVDGMHSRLSDFPFLAGFHVTRATLRDVYVMGARPVALLSDIHVADDGDIAKIFDYTAGIAVVAEAMGVPLVTGSTLRIGGDMVLGDRMTGCVGAVGVADHLTPRKETRPGDVILMTAGAGGGTIAATALYSGYHEVVEETINLHFLRAAEALLKSPALAHIHTMTDVTNGGLRGDVYEMAGTADCRIVIDEEHLRSLVEPRVLAMLDALEIDYLGVSLDALLVVVPPAYADEIMAVIRGAGVPVERIGRVEAGPAASVLLSGGKECDFQPRFRESAYTPVKKVVDTEPRDFDEMKEKVRAAADAAVAKKERILDRLRKSE
ncbi:MAG: hydrogenase expression/formation protein [Methanofollis sp.]|nr:hydrogenase expression/formation protein [Methanofollis sp.]